MQRVNLLTFGGGLVAEVEIPPFKVMPDVILWGSRHFTKTTWTKDGAHEYKEVFAYQIPEFCTACKNRID